jgi:hypothetical protein
MYRSTLAAGVVLSYVTLRQRKQAADAEPTNIDAELTTVEAAELGLAELVLGESLEPHPQER